MLEMMTGSSSSAKTPRICKVPHVLRGFGVQGDFGRFMVWGLGIWLT